MTNSKHGWTFFVAVLAILSGTRVSYGLATEQVGPDSAQRHPTTAQPGWPSGMIKLLRRESRVYSIWANGNENFYFKASPDEFNELIRLFSETRMRDHELRIKAGKKHVKSFNGDKISYNVNFHVLGGIALGSSRSSESPNTYEPTLTIYVDPSAEQALWKQITLPTNSAYTDHNGGPLAVQAGIDNFGEPAVELSILLTNVIHFT